MLRNGAGGPEDAVFRVQLGGQGEARGSGVQTVLREPRSELTLSVEPETVPHMPDQVVHGTEAVVSTAPRVAEQGVLALSVGRNSRHLENAGRPDGGNHLHI